MKHDQYFSNLPFRFFNVWAEHNEFLPLVEREWKQRKARNHMKNVWLHLKGLKPVLKALNNEEYKNVSLKISQDRAELSVIQEQLNRNWSGNRQEQEKNALQKLEKWFGVEESILKQKSRARWIKLGDANTHYFFEVMKERAQRKQITILTSLIGIKLTKPTNIQTEVVQFYKGLTGSSTYKLTTHKLTTINKLIMRVGPVLNHQQKKDICILVIDKEIAESLKAIEEDKTPGIDGYNACFIKESGL
ncbi:uncharacterized protein LOC124898561 [Capsicum annuum]|uniref:uncharacterized protein LOC124898561 n=1 Tax=Capsicum annuum TaxID=4072 RepID=UPI001FB128B6|nr:uncharacterized protein LOC124898561 [Capsicum annuum]